MIKNKPYKAVIFDMDGTLLNTLKDITNSMNRSLRHFNYPVHNIATYKKFIGDGIDTLAYRVLPIKQRNEKNVQKLISLFSEYYDRHWCDETELYPGISALLNCLKKHSVKMAILTNKPHDFAIEMSNFFLSKWYFSKILGANERMQKKPAPEMAYNLCKDLQIEPKESIFIGDSDIDIKTAKASGMLPVGVAWGFRPIKELKDSGANYVINNPLEFVRLIN